MASLDELVIAFITKNALPSSTSAESAAEKMTGANTALENNHDFNEIEQAFARLLKTHGVNAPSPANKRGAPAAQRGASSNAMEKRQQPVHVSAPYRFVSVEDRVIPGTVIDISTPQPGHLSASIAVTWKAESPLLIGETRTETIKGKGPQTVLAPFTLGGESEYAIPGASLRGMIRAAVETVAMARLSPINDHLACGFTHTRQRRSVGDVLRNGHPHHTIKAAEQHTPDFVENLFGYVVEPTDPGMAEGTRAAASKIARRGRVAFSMATLAPQEKPQTRDSIETVLMGPRPSFAPFYLDYPPSAGTTRLAGRKRYLPRFPDPAGKTPKEFVERMAAQQITNIIAASKGKPVSGDVKCRLQFLLPEEGKQAITFTSTIRLSNVSEAELGAVLFALTHGGCLSHSGTQAETPFRHMIGHAKPFGAGQVKVEAAVLSVKWNNTAGKETQVDHRRFLEAFQAHMRSNGVTGFPNTPSLREFLGACCPAETAKVGAGSLRYLDLDEYQQVKKACVAHKGKRPAPLKPAHGTALIEKHATRLLPAPSYIIPS